MSEKGGNLTVERLLQVPAQSETAVKVQQLLNKSFRFFFLKKVCKTNFPQNRTQFPFKKLALAKVIQLLIFSTSN